MIASSYVNLVPLLDRSMIEEACAESYAAKRRATSCRGLLNLVSSVQIVENLDHDFCKFAKIRLPWPIARVQQGA